MYHGSVILANSQLRALMQYNTATVELRFNEPLFNELLGITNKIFRPAKIAVKCMEKNLDLTNLDLTSSLIRQPKLKIYFEFTSI